MFDSPRYLQYKCSNCLFWQSRERDRLRVCLIERQNTGIAARNKILDLSVWDLREKKMTASEGREIGNRSLSCLSNHHRIIALRNEESQETFTEEERGVMRGSGGGSGPMCQYERCGDGWCLVLKIKITIRQAPILSAMRIKFVGSVNNKKQACSLLSSKY